MPRIIAQADPTPEEIATLCAELQAAWTDRERRRRQHGNIAHDKCVVLTGWRPPLVHVADVSESSCPPQ